MTKVSIIVPVYNVENYLDEAIYSLINQTYKDIEIILVNDGSTDNSGNICDEYALKDNRIKVYHRQNSGLSASRNFGVMHASSEWIVFLDSDDYYELYAVEYLMTIQKENNLDLVITPIRMTSKRSDYSNLILSELMINQIKIYDKEEALIDMFYGKNISVSACGKLYRRKILLKFPYTERMIYEDLDKTYEHILNSPRIGKAPLNIYIYYRREGSIVNSYYSKKNLDFFRAMENNFEYIKRDFPNHKKLNRAICARYAISGLYIVNAMLKSKMYDDVKQLKKVFKPYIKKVLIDNNVSNKNKIKLLLFAINPKLYEKIRMKYIDE